MVERVVNDVLEIKADITEIKQDLRRSLDGRRAPRPYGGASTLPHSRGARRRRPAGPRR
jgi:hypothetical protein